MNAYVKALRLPFTAGSVVPVLIGAALAFSQGFFDVALLGITVLGVACIHLGANLLNDYYDAKGSDPINLRLTPFSGGSRVIQQGELRPAVILAMSVAFFLIGVLCGIWLVIEGRPLVLVIGGLGLLAGWSYSAPPLQFMSRGWGEVVIFLAFGPLVTLGSYYVMSNSLSFQAFCMGIPQGFLIAAVIWINQFPDYEADKAAGKNNLVVRLGPSRARYLYLLIILFSYVSVVALAGVYTEIYLIMISFASLPLAARAIKILMRHYGSHQEIIPAQAATIQVMTIHGLLVTLGLVLSRWVGD